MKKFLFLLIIFFSIAEHSCLVCFDDYYLVPEEDASKAEEAFEDYVFSGGDFSFSEVRGFAWESNVSYIHSSYSYNEFEMWLKSIVPSLYKVFIKKNVLTQKDREHLLNYSLPSIGMEYSRIKNFSNSLQENYIVIGYATQWKNNFTNKVQGILMQDVIPGSYNKWWFVALEKFWSEYEEAA